MGQGMNAQGMAQGFNMPNFEDFDLNKWSNQCQRDGRSSRKKNGRKII